MSFGLNKFLKNLLPKQLFYRALLIVAAPIIILQITISIVFFDSLWIKTNKGMTRALVGEARAINSDLNYFKNKFIMPVEGIISGVYGSQRILNGKPRWPHYGIDIAANQGTQIKSSGSGVVTMAEDDLYYTGGTIIMDHGHGISTIYSHLESVIVSVGDKINQGDIIGTVGSTGRSTGPHLDFRINWFQTRLDPMSVLN